MLLGFLADRQRACRRFFRVAARKEGFQAIETHDRGVDLPRRVVFVVDRNVGEKQKPLSRMIERDDGVVEEKESLGDRALAGMTVRNLFEGPHRVIRQETDGAGGERRQILVRQERPARDDLFERPQRVPRHLDAAAAALLPDARAFDRDPCDGTASQERVSGNRLSSGHAFQEEALGPRAAHAREKRHGSQRVPDEHAGDRHRGPNPGLAEKHLPFRRPIDHAGLPFERISRICSGAASATPKRRAWRTAWAANIWRPSTVGHRAARAAAMRGVGVPSRR